MFILLSCACSPTIPLQRPFSPPNIVTQSTRAALSGKSIRPTELVLNARWSSVVRHKRCRACAGPPSSCWLLTSLRRVYRSANTSISCLGIIAWLLPLSGAAVLSGPVLYSLWEYTPHARKEGNWTASITRNELEPSPTAIRRPLVWLSSCQIRCWSQKL